jgi:Uma2 family endonuclease
MLYETPCRVSSPRARLLTRRNESYRMHMHALSRQWTADDLLDMPDDGQRYEVIDGELFVTPAPSWDHQAALGTLYIRLAEYPARERIGYVFFSPADIRFSPRRAVQPDLFVVPLIDGRRPREFGEMKHLLLAVEASSSSTARLDRVKKRLLCREEGVEEFWIVDLDARTFDRSTPADSRIDVLDVALTWLPAGASSPFELDIADYFVRVLDT